MVINPKNHTLFILGSSEVSRGFLALLLEVLKNNMGYTVCDPYAKLAIPTSGKVVINCIGMGDEDVDRKLGMVSNGRSHLHVHIQDATGATIANRCPRTNIMMLHVSTFVGEIEQIFLHPGNPHSSMMLEDLKKHLETALHTGDMPEIFVPLRGAIPATA